MSSFCFTPISQSHCPRLRISAFSECQPQDLFVVLQLSSPIPNQIEREGEEIKKRSGVEKDTGKETGKFPSGMLGLNPSWWKSFFGSPRQAVGLLPRSFSAPRLTRTANTFQWASCPSNF